MKRARANQQKARDPGRAEALFQASVSDRPFGADEETEDEVWVAQMMEWLTAPRADPSAEMVRRVIARVECLT